MLTDVRVRGLAARARASPSNMILIISSRRDAHIHCVTQHLDAMGQRWIRLNTETFASNCTLCIDPATGTGDLHFLDSGLSVHLSSVTSVWYRKPDPPVLSHFNVDQSTLDYVEAEFNELLNGVYSLLDSAAWINNPFTTRIAHRKLLQLRVANSLGFRVPKSIITNRADVALRFAESVGWDVAIKSLGALSVHKADGNTQLQFGLFTRRLTKDELLATSDKIEHMPTLFQEYIAKDFELRVTCVGDDVFCCRIDSQQDELCREDMRFNIGQLHHEMMDNAPLARMLQAYLRAFGLNFGCFDIAVLSTGEYVFFECNPNGQWLWVEELTGAPIGASVAKLLSMPVPAPGPQICTNRLPVRYAAHYAETQEFSVKKVGGKLYRAD